MIEALRETTDRRHILSELENLMPPKRMRHVLGVEEAAIRLAEVYASDTHKASVAALYHDYAKFFTFKKSLEILEKYHYIPDPIEKNSMDLLHAKVAAKIAEHEYGITDYDIINAIAYHTTGREGMSLLEKIIFVADATEKHRSYDGVEEIRTEAFRDLDQAVLLLLNRQICFLIETKRLIHPDSVIARNYYLKLRSI